jgi:3'-5' exoribonuclease
MDGTIWKDPQKGEFVRTCLKKHREKLVGCPAATQIHHAYPSGLLIHTAEVLQICQSISPCLVPEYDFVDTDVLYGSAILHDIGKMETYQINQIGLAESLYTERAIGHMVYGIHIAMEMAKEMEIDQDFVTEILHCISAHHGKVEYGSINSVQSQEALILSCADLISSRNGMIQGKLKEYVEKKIPLPNTFDIYRDHYFASIGMKNYIEKKIHGDSNKVV